MNKKSLLAGIVLAVPALALAPRGVVPSYVPLAHADDAPKEPTPEELGKQAWQVLDKHCTACHGQGKRNYRVAPIASDTLPKLIEMKIVVPGKPDDSPLYTLMIDKDDPMPPPKIKERPKAEEIATIKTWIEKGAPAWPTEKKE